MFGYTGALIHTCIGRQSALHLGTPVAAFGLGTAYHGARRLFTRRSRGLGLARITGDFATTIVHVCGLVGFNAS